MTRSTLLDYSSSTVDLLDSSLLLFPHLKRVNRCPARIQDSHDSQNPRHLASWLSTSGATIFVPSLRCLDYSVRTPVLTRPRRLAPPGFLSSRLSGVPRSLARRIEFPDITPHAVTSRKTCWSRGRFLSDSLHKSLSITLNLHIFLRRDPTRLYLARLLLCSKSKYSTNRCLVQV